MSAEERAQEEQEAIRRVLDGERDAYAFLVERYSGPLYRYLVRMVDRPDDAEDLLQEAFLRAYLALASYDPAYRFSTWLFRIATNLALNRIRAAGRVVSLEALREDPDAPPVVLADHREEGRPEARVERSELAEVIRECLNLLPPAYRLVVTLRHVAELSYTEIADCANLPVNTVRSRLHRGRERLGECLREHLPEEDLP